MTLLEEIRDGCTDESADISSLLRKALILATRLKSKDLETWTLLELYGFGPNVGHTPPNYRIVDEPPHEGHFSGKHGTYAEPIVYTKIASSSSRKIQTVALVQPVSALAELLKSGKQSFSFPLEAELVEDLNFFTFQGRLRSAAFLIERETVASVVDKIRTTLLSFVLGLERLDPLAGAPGHPAPPTEQVVQVYNQTILQATFTGRGDVVTTNQNVTTNVSNSQGVQLAFGDGNVQRLDMLAKQGSDADKAAVKAIQDLKTAIEANVTDAPVRETALGHLNGFAGQLVASGAARVVDVAKAFFAALKLALVNHPVLLPLLTALGTAAGAVFGLPLG